MFTQLPEHLDPWWCAERGILLSGAAPLRALPRLRELLLDQEGVVDYQIRFDRDDWGRPQIRGRVSADLVLECQRCLGSLSLPITVELRLIAVRGLEEARTIEDPFDPLLAEGGLCSPLEMIEEELLLALPHIPVHSEPACEAPAWRGEDARTSAARVVLNGEAINPFAALADLKIPTKH